MSDANISNDQPLPPGPSYSDTMKPEEPAGPKMSMGETLASIFFEPGRTFEALRARPRFLIAGLILIVAYMIFSTLYFQKIGYERIVRAQADQQRAKSNATEEQVEQGVQFQLKPAFKVFRLLSPIIGFVIVIAAGAALYLLGAMLMGRGISYKQALSVWVYSSLPPTVLIMLLNIVLLFIHPPEDDAEVLQGAGRGLVHANPSILVNGTDHPVLATALGSIDAFAIYGLFLGALGLRLVGKMSSGTAWTIVLGLWIIGLVLRVAIATLTGNVIA
ncbi:MAG TPA: YIP1 family protein [Pyrinomonadaceae bacterium]|nr:YIP1 family protein [Pyrinomonadaceae bacterium]